MFEGDLAVDSYEPQVSSCFLYLGELQHLPIGNGNNMGTRYLFLLTLEAWEHLRVAGEFLHSAF